MRCVVYFNPPPSTDVFCVYRWLKPAISDPQPTVLKAVKLKIEHRFDQKESLKTNFMTVWLSSRIGSVEDGFKQIKKSPFLCTSVQ